MKIISGAGANQTLSSLLYDFSGSSYHYNADFGVGFPHRDRPRPGDGHNLEAAFAPKPRSRPATPRR